MLISQDTEGVAPLTVQKLSDFFEPLGNDGIEVGNVFGHRWWKNRQISILLMLA
jgi:hypothetical protein